uniref:Resistin n=2 Tax=Pongo abelii TaxID=9601 RepID=H2NXB1_PONAB
MAPAGSLGSRLSLHPCPPQPGTGVQVRGSRSHSLHGPDLPHMGRADPAVGLLVPSFSACRMKAVCLLLLPVLGLLVSSESLCSLEEAINEKIQEGASSLIFRAIRSIDLECQSVTSRGDLATCPRGFAVTGCTCGSACGSWDVRAETTCHCQCAGMDWTGARCCRVQP